MSHVVVTSPAVAANSQIISALHAGVAFRPQGSLLVPVMDPNGEIAHAAFSAVPLRANRFWQSVSDWRTTLPDRFSWKDHTFQHYVCAGKKSLSFAMRGVPEADLRRAVHEGAKVNLEARYALTDAEQGLHLEQCTLMRMKPALNPRHSRVFSKEVYGVNGMLFVMSAASLFKFLPLLKPSEVYSQDLLRRVVQSLILGKNGKPFVKAKLVFLLATLLSLPDEILKWASEEKPSPEKVIYHEGMLKPERGSVEKMKNPYCTVFSFRAREPHFKHDDGRDQVMKTFRLQLVREFDFSNDGVDAAFSAEQGPYFVIRVHTNIQRQQLTEAESFSPQISSFMESLLWYVVS
ncbi:MAG: hypothetical protein COX62_07260 [Deltaproteobacteria bacterium CG_4_10_14_0_2_um_filter_43_8]|nr:MAG: hypothetical protein COV43_08880 [Deltaproteobacteria bacterium CG11_big_fil_rev_8_21_14_0_20_42_23]PJA19098.1 MAG: hypothetical protein COX62_07260 [Deltaproteobacteria bacterium CG_4_10_14_0_2_um_filter_43_8]PJC64932.1 MAG: hypothetical protein CO021_01765 [Deltaproteobacteria bacterium CG_4_9_14_0_2_um_filter_42_21]